MKDNPEFTAQYHVNARQGRFEVVDTSGRVVVVCRDQASAVDYAVLLNEQPIAGAAKRDIVRRAQGLNSLLASKVWEVFQAVTLPGGSRGG